MKLINNIAKQNKYSCIMIKNYIFRFFLLKAFD